MLVILKIVFTFASCFTKIVFIMNTKELNSVKLMAVEAFEILDHLNSFAISCTMKNGDYFVVDEFTYERLLHMLRLLERAYVEKSLDWFEFGNIPSFSTGNILKAINS